MAKDKEITFITAFFDINRKSWDGYNRGNDLYFQYFLHWSNINNDIIVYVGDEKIRQEIIKARANIREHSTVVEVIPDIFLEDEELLNSIKSVNYSIANHYRLMNNNPEAINYNYNYIMMMKYHLLKKAILEKKITGPVAWIDFGFDHGGENYETSYFDFCAEYGGNNIILFSLFSLAEIQGLSVIDLVLRMETAIQGSLIIGPSDKIINLCEDAIIAQKKLNSCGLMDDDQITLLMGYKNRPDDFTVVHCDWHKGMFYLKEQKIVLSNRIGIIKKIARNLKWGIKKSKYSIFLLLYLLTKHAPK